MLMLSTWLQYSQSLSCRDVSLIEGFITEQCRKTEQRAAARCL